MLDFATARYLLQSSTTMEVMLDDDSLLPLPIVVFYITVELHISCPSVFAKQVADGFLQGWGNKARAIAILEVVGAVGQPDDTIADSRLHAFRHVAVEDMEHAFGEAYLLVAAIHWAIVSCHTLKMRVDAIVSAVGVGHMLPNLPSQTLGAQRAIVNITYGVAILGFLNQ